jgi:hypothetical protein
MAYSLHRQRHPEADVGNCKQDANERIHHPNRIGAHNHAWAAASKRDRPLEDHMVARGRGRNLGFGRIEIAL